MKEMRMNQQHLACKNKETENDWITEIQIPVK